MATYITIDNKGRNVSQLAAMPVEIEHWLRLSVIDYVSVGTHGDQPHFTVEEEGVTVKVTSTRQEKTPQFLVKIEILGANLEAIARLHIAALARIGECAKKKPAISLRWPGGK